MYAGRYVCMFVSLYMHMDVGVPVPYVCVQVDM